MSHLSYKSRARSIRPASPSRIAKQQLKQAQDYETKIQQRVSYLAKEEQKFMKKIEKTRDDAVRLQKIKTDKISNL